MLCSLFHVRLSPISTSPLPECSLPDSAVADGLAGMTTESGRHRERHQTRLLAGRTLRSLIPPLPQTPLICSTDACPQRRACPCRQRVFKKNSHRDEDHHRGTQVRGTAAGAAFRFSIHSGLCRCEGVSSSSPGLQMSSLTVIWWL